MDRGHQIGHCITLDQSGASCYKNLDLIFVPTTAPDLAKAAAILAVDLIR